MYVLPLFVAVEVKGELNDVPKNHSNSGVDVPAGRGCGMMTTEHCKLTVSPAVTVIGVEGEMDTGPMVTVDIGKLDKPEYYCTSRMIIMLRFMIIIVQSLLLTDVDVNSVPQQLTAETSSF